MVWNTIKLKRGEGDFIHCNDYVLYFSLCLAEKQANVVFYGILFSPVVISIESNETTPGKLQAELFSSVYKAI